MSPERSAGLLDRMRLGSMERCEAARSRIGAAELRAAVADAAPPRPLRLSALGFDLIAEVKRRSPSEGDLSGTPPSDVDAEASGARDTPLGSRRPSSLTLEERIDVYARAGAVAISVLTEPHEFNGSLSDLVVASDAATVPTMRKDFLVDPYQVLEARAAGASGVLLIVRLLSDRQLQDLLGMCATVGMFALVEAFDRRDLERAEQVLRLAPVSPWFPGDSGPALRRPGYVPCLVGLNSRNLQTLEVDQTRFGELVGSFPPGFPRVAESGMSTPTDALRAAAMGYRLGLVGSALMKSPDPGRLLTDMLSAARSEHTRRRHAG